MSRKRFTALILIFFSIFILLIIRIYYLSIYSGEKLARAASIQRISNSNVEKLRGGILDRNGITFTDRTVKASIVLKPLILRGKQDDISKICYTAGLDQDKLIKEISTKREPLVIEIDEGKFDELKSLKIDGMSVIRSLSRYSSNTIARHIIGYLSKADQKGETGIEKYYNDVLSIKGDNRMSVITDAKNNIIKGIGYRVLRFDEQSKKNNIKLTLDYHIQKIVEDVMSNNGITGSVVVEDVTSGDILAAVSKPDFDQYDIGKYLKSPGNELFNRSVASYNLGSIFKIIDMACIYEYNLPHYSYFNCTGSIKIGDKEYKCSSYESGGHGIVNMDEAFAKSCNPYFIKFGIDIGSQKLTEMARRFGLGQLSGLNEQGINESAGNIPDGTKKYTDGEIANISIGQGSVMATPVQVADVIATVANGGIKNKINIVDSIIDSSGRTVKTIKNNQGVRIISKQTSNNIKNLMEKVIESGTGKKANMDSIGGAGGKTGSAETGQYINGQKVVHAWFAGYFPKNNPKYSIAVFIEDGKAGGEVAAPVFAAVATEMKKKGY